MDISEAKQGEASILALSGRLDAVTSKAFEEKVHAAIESGARRLVVDLARLEYVSSSGLRVLLLAAKQLRGMDGDIRLCSLQDHVQQVFDLAGFSSILSIYGSRDEAVKSVISREME